MPSPREWRKDLTKLAAQYGYDLEIRKGGHYRLSKPDHPTVFASGTSSDWRAFKNLEARLKRHQQ